MERPARPPLTRQQSVVLELLVRGLTNDEIGARLGISEGTVKAHVSGLLRTLRCSNRAALAACAVRLGLVRGQATNADDPDAQPKRD
jgi:DNA-binding NarL/FixJ family response regulator